MQTTKKKVITLGARFALDNVYVLHIPTSSLAVIGRALYTYINN